MCNRDQHRLKIGGGAADRPENIGNRCLLFQGFGQIPGALFDLALQLRVRVLEAFGHCIELIGQRFQFVTATHFDAVIERARTNAPRAFPQDLDRRNHAPHKIQTRCRRNRNAGQHEQHGTQDRRIQRRKRLGDREVYEYRPAQRCNGGMGGENGVPIQVFSNDGFKCRARVPILHDIAHLAQQGHVRLLQNNADVRVRDQPALLVHDIRAAAAADFEIGDHVPDKLEVGFRDNDARIFRRSGHRYGHVGL